ATSSPFWRSRPTGLKGYRLAAYDELPRTGVPELLRSKEEFDAYVDALVQAGVMQDASYIWWSMRPSLTHPTLELRAPSWSRTNGGPSVTACTAASSATTARSRLRISSIRWSTRPRPTPRRSAA